MSLLLQVFSKNIPVSIQRFLSVKKFLMALNFCYTCYTCYAPRPNGASGRASDAGLLVIVRTIHLLIGKRGFLGNF